MKLGDEVVVIDADDDKYYVDDYGIVIDIKDDMYLVDFRTINATAWFKKHEIRVKE